MLTRSNSRIRRTGEKTSLDEEVTPDVVVVVVGAVVVVVVAAVVVVVAGDKMIIFAKIGRRRS